MEDIAQEVSLRLVGVLLELQLRADGLLGRQRAHVRLQEHVAVPGVLCSIELN